jgi:hypothetical protein
MGFLLTHIFIVSVFSWLTLVAGLTDHSASDAITCDVAIIGGGASGTYAAISLSNAGKSVVVIEKEDALGGHTNTYADPATNQTIDYGVVVFKNEQLVKDYFNLLNISWKVVPNSAFGSAVLVGVDIHTGKRIPNYNFSNATTGLQVWASQLAKYPYLDGGFFLPDPVPEELLLPFGEFVAKYANLSSLVDIFFDYGQGAGDLLRQPTLYILKQINADFLRDTEIGWISTADNHQIYDKAVKLLGQNVLLRSRVISTDRSANDSVTVIVKTPLGKKTIRAKKLLLALLPKLENLVGFDLDATEKALFGQFMSVGYYTSLVNNTGLPANLTIHTVDPDNSFILPQLPAVYVVSPTIGPGLFQVTYGSATGTESHEYIKADILTFLKKLQQSDIAKKVWEPEFVAYKAHVPFFLTVSSDAIRSGFYKDLYALQGQRNTYYTGAAFQSQDSFMVWNFTKYHVLPQLLASL